MATTNVGGRPGAGPPLRFQDHRPSPAAIRFPDFTRYLAETITSGHYAILIVGTGPGGSQVAVALRHRGFAGPIAMVGEEVGYPYERPPLSKDYLAGEKSLERILIKPGKFWADRD